MIALLVIAASAGVTAVAGLWLYAHPAARARLLAALPPAERFRAASPWAAGVIAVFVLVAGHLGEAAAWAVTAAALGGYDHACRTAESGAVQVLAERAHTATAERARDRLADALHDAQNALACGDPDAARTHINAALSGDGYHGRLLGAQNALVEALTKLDVRSEQADAEDWTQTGPITLPGMREAGHP